MAEEIKQTIGSIMDKAIQIGIVVDDLEKACANMEMIFGVKPNFIKDMQYPWVVYKGEPSDTWARVASFTQFGIEFEFMTPMGTGSSTWGDHFNEAPRSGYSLHHIRFSNCDDNDVVSELFKEKGIDILMEGRSCVSPNGKFTYYDTRDLLGFIVEVVTKPDAPAK